jgi:hypothetical protein
MVRPTEVSCNADGVIQGGGFASIQDGRLNVVCEFQVDTNSDEIFDGWRVTAINLDSTTSQIQAIAECGVPVPLGNG